MKYMNKTVQIENVLADLGELGHPLLDAIKKAEAESDSK